MFFDFNSYFIDEKVNFLKFENEYKVFNESGESIGSIKQKLSGGDKVMRLIFDKANLPFHLDIEDNSSHIQASIVRGWSFFLSKISVIDSNGIKIGSIKQKFTLMKPSFKIFDENENYIAEITGDWVGWSFVIRDASGNQIGSISKKWAGIAKEFFTTADKYNVIINPGFDDLRNKMVILSCAITVDMVLKESK